MWAQLGSNQRPTDYESATLTLRYGPRTLCSGAKIFICIQLKNNSALLFKKTCLFLRKEAYFIAMNQIKNIIFDLGGVILNIDYQLTVNAFKKIGIENFDQLYSQKEQSLLFNKLETGHISKEDFFSEIEKIAPRPITHQQIISAWNAMLLDLPEERINLLKSLRYKYRIFLLSNTNRIHVESFSTYIDHIYGDSLFKNLFHSVYYSCEIGMRKPDREIFEFVLRKNSLVSNETLFIDDSIQHIEGARKLGIQTQLLEKGKTISELLENF
jgi:glucose-1-phosphatase